MTNEVPHLPTTPENLAIVQASDVLPPETPGLSPVVAVESKRIYLPRLVERMILRAVQGDRFLRVVHVENGTGFLWLVDIHDNSYPFRIALSQIYLEWGSSNAAYRLELHDPWDDPAQGVPTGDAELPKKSKGGARAGRDEETKYRPATEYAEEIRDLPPRHRERAHLVMCALKGDNHYRLLWGESRGRLIKSIATDIGSNRQTLTKLLLLFWKRGGTWAALRPDFDRCGAPGKRKPVSPDSQIGRPPIYSPRGVSVSPLHKQFMETAAHFYLNTNASTLEQAIDSASRIHAIPVPGAASITKSVEIDTFSLPNSRQLRYYLDEEYPHRERSIRRDGQKNWNLFERAILGTASEEVQGPCDRFAIDATIADLYLVSQYDRNMIVGRPVIYFAVDVFSRLICGFYVGFEGPSWIGAMMCLVNCSMDKVAYCASLDIPIAEDDWPSHHMPRMLLADRGELMSVKLGKNIVNHLRILIENAPSGRPELKAVVERRFAIVPNIWKPYVPGYVRPDFGERGTKDYRVEAAMDLAAFTRIVALSVLEANAAVIRDIAVHPEMTAVGMRPTPLDLWHWGVANRSGSLRYHPPATVALNVMPTARARLTGSGLFFKGGYYTFPSAEKDRNALFAEARHKERALEVSYDPRDHANLYVHDKSLPGGYEACHLLPRSVSLTGKSLHETEQLEIERRTGVADYQNEHAGIRIATDIAIEKIVADEVAATNMARRPGMSKAELTQGIRENRNQEKELNRPNEALVLPGGVPAPVQPTPKQLSVAPAARAGKDEKDDKDDQDEGDAEARYYASLK